MTMNSRVTKALLGTYSRRGPLFSVVYLRQVQPHFCYPLLSWGRDLSAFLLCIGNHDTFNTTDCIAQPALVCVHATPLTRLAHSKQNSQGIPTMLCLSAPCWAAHRRSTFSQVPSNQEEGCAPPTDRGVAYVTATLSPSLNGCTANRKKPAPQQPACAHTRLSRGLGHIRCSSLN